MFSWSSDRDGGTLAKRDRRKQQLGEPREAGPGRTPQAESEVPPAGGRGPGPRRRGAAAAIREPAPQAAFEAMRNNEGNLECRLGERRQLKAGRGKPAEM